MQPTTDGDPEPHELLSAFLADSDASCPSCRYNLRGVTGRTCPECGVRLRLGLHESSGLGRRWGLLLLLFCWLLLAGTMNDVRTYRGIHRTLTSAQWRFVTANTTMQFGPLGGTLSSDREIILRSQPAPAPRGGLPQPPGNFSVRYTAPEAGLNWSAVSWGQWGAAAWWTSLAAAAVVGIGLLLRYRKRDVSPAVARGITAMAWLGFMGYFAFHAVTFVNELR